MGRLGKYIRAGINTGLCALGPCGLERKYKFSKQLVDFARSIETTPFSGTRLYPFMASRLSRPLYAVIAEEIVSAGRYKRVLDIDTGLGFLPIEIMLRDPDAYASGIDASKDMIKYAKANAKTCKTGRPVHFAQGDAAILPYPGRHFDLVIDVGILHHLSNLKSVFMEANQVLLPGGEFWICDYKDDITAEEWESIRMKLPARCRVPFAVGLMASAMSAYGEANLLETAAETKFEVIALERKTFTLLGQPMPLFNMLKLRKPSSPIDNEAPSEA